MFFMIFVEKNKGFARLLSREALSSDEQNVSDNVNQFYERLELVLRQMFKENEAVKNSSWYFCTTNSYCTRGKY